eukprot:scaffold3184_cov105-Isochrysis_galbana.AAC.3
MPSLVPRHRWSPRTLATARWRPRRVSRRCPPPSGPSTRWIPTRPRTASPSASSWPSSAGAPSGSS